MHANGSCLVAGLFVALCKPGPIGFGATAFIAAFNSVSGCKLHYSNDLSEKSTKYNVQKLSVHISGAVLTIQRTVQLLLH